MAAVPDHEIIPRVLAKIALCDIVAHRMYSNPLNMPRAARFAAAADKLRDFATVELLCSDLGITRKDLN